ncbi:uncharacterized protein YMR106W-A [Saccharomyces cerevisiae S288C]|uniref:Uncharacterized protein YMR106W-A n=1 Tax=Saccharomyces cerevisiae (strain ATCC 204508 / S288c) TaxID=559292 RepID=YM106_YEAST|nr:hypothetical protein INSC1019_23130 [Saccharomyces cerevisiae]
MISMEAINNFIKTAPKHDYLTGGVHHSGNVDVLQLSGNKEDGSLVWNHTFVDVDNNVVAKFEDALEKLESLHRRSSSSTGNEEHANV